MTKAFPVLLIAVAGSLAAPAATAGDTDIDPPITITSTDCEAAFAAYQRQFKAHYFALSQDGKVCVYSYCATGCRPTNLRQRALYRCERQSKGVPCRIHAYGGKVIPNAAAKP